VNAVVTFGLGFEVRVDRLHDVPDVSSRLLNVEDSSVFESRPLDEREEVVVECQ
jgi:hypothetical protein